MPIYEYRCENGHEFETLQGFDDEAISECEECGAPCKRVFHPVHVHFRGSGFYTTDYGKKGSKKPASESGGSSNGSKKESSKSDSGSSSSSSSKSSSD